MVWSTTSRRLPAAGTITGSSSIQPSSSARNLGVFIDSDLSMGNHVKRTFSCCFSTLPTAVFQSLVVALVLSRLDYCNSVLVRLPVNLIQHLQSVQNAAIGLIFRDAHGYPDIRINPDNFGISEYPFNYQSVWRLALFIFFL